jgi:hypothetical protein
MAAARAEAFAIRGLPVPELVAPEPPRLLPVTDAADIAWQGSVGATGYQVERARKKGGPWQIIATNVDEAFTQYRPEFADENVPAGKWYYRVRAQSGSGQSEPSNLAGPVRVTTETLVDELADFSRVESRTGDWRIANRNCRSAKEDAHRAAGEAGAALVYRVSTSIRGFRVFAHFRDVAAEKASYFGGAGEYGYWQPVLFYAEKLGGGTWLRIELAGATQVGRVEIAHAAPSP